MWSLSFQQLPLAGLEGTATGLHSCALPTSGPGAQALACQAASVGPASVSSAWQRSSSLSLLTSTCHPRDFRERNSPPNQMPWVDPGHRFFSHLPSSRPHPDFYFLAFSLSLLLLPFFSPERIGRHMVFHGGSIHLQSSREWEFLLHTFEDI